jgi:GNAT superfamily N-acetyltransferase
VYYRNNQSFFYAKFSRADSKSETSVIKPFKSSDNDLNGFLFDDAKNYQKELMAVTYIIEDNTCDKTIAYFSLLNDKITFDAEQRSIWNKLNRNITNAKRRKHYPAVKIGRLAISESYAGKGLGKDIIRFIKFMFASGSRTGCRFITVDAYQNAVGFYQKCGFNFISTKDKNDATRLMYYDLKRFIYCV